MATQTHLHREWLARAAAAATQAAARAAVGAAVEALVLAGERAARAAARGRELGRLVARAHEHRVVRRLALAVEPHLVDIRDAQVGEAVEQVVHVLRLGVGVLLHPAVDLRRNEVAKLVPHRLVRDVVGHALEPPEQLERGLVVHHALDGARERLRAEARPEPRLHHVLLRPDRVRLVGALADPAPLEEIEPVLLVESLHVQQRRDAVRVLGEQVRARHNDVLGVERREHRPRHHVLERGRARHVHQQRVDEEREPPHRLARARLGVGVGHGEQPVERHDRAARERLVCELVELRGRVPCIRKRERAGRRARRREVAAAGADAYTRVIA